MQDKDDAPAWTDAQFARAAISKDGVVVRPATGTLTKRALKAVKQPGLYSVLKDGKFWFGHKNPNTFRGMVMAQCNPSEIQAMLEAQAA